MKTQHPMPLAAARQALLARSAPCPSEVIPLPAALDRVSARDLYAPRSLPEQARSRMDGYAVAGSDLLDVRPERPVLLRLRPETAAAGHPLETAVVPGEAMRILTGAPIPAGADLVVPDEQAHLLSGRVAIATAFRPGDWVLPPGADVRRGEPIAAAGRILTPAVLALCAACGWDAIEVVKRPRVAVLGTGDELLELGEPWRAPMQYCNSRLLMEWLVAAHGGVALNLGNAADDAEAVAGTLDRAEAEAVISTGGTGFGDRDVLRDAWNILGITPIFRGLGLTPGGGSAFGVKNGTGYLALPGSPWAAEAVFMQLGLPWLRSLAGADPDAGTLLPAVLESTLNNRRASARMVPGRLQRSAAALRFQPLITDTGSVFARIHRRNAYLLVPEFSTLEKGCIVPAALYDPSLHCPIPLDP